VREVVEQVSQIVRGPVAHGGVFGTDRQTGSAVTHSTPDQRPTTLIIYYY
jgi:hypothetical protein